MASADDSQPRWRVRRPTTYACTSLHPHRSRPPCYAVDQSKMRRRKRGGETLDEDLFVPKQLGLLAVPGLLGLPPALTVR